MTHNEYSIFITYFGTLAGPRQKQNKKKKKILTLYCIIVRKCIIIQRHTEISAESYFATRCAASIVAFRDCCRLHHKHFVYLNFCARSCSLLHFITRASSFMCVCEKATHNERERERGNRARASVHHSILVKHMRCSQ